MEYHLFAIRDVTGVAFDTYLLDEDSIFLSAATGVDRDDVVSTGPALAEGLGLTY